MNNVTDLVAANRDRLMIDRLKTLGVIAGGMAAIVGATYAKHPIAQTLLGLGAVGAGLAAEATDRRVRLGGQLAESTDRIAMEAIAKAYQSALSPAQLQQAILPAAESGPLPQAQWWPDLLRYPSLLIYGQFGSGKTSLAKRLVSDRQALGHSVKVLDPHMAAGAWDGCETVGAGMNYTAVDQALADFASEVESRYKILATEKGASFQPITFICDEFTNWSDRTKNAADFFAMAMADTRKIAMFVAFIPHSAGLNINFGIKCQKRLYLFTSKHHSAITRYCSL